MLIIVKIELRRLLLNRKYIYRREKIKNSINDINFK